MYFGELAALGAAFLWTGTSICFTESGRRIGSAKVNRLRLVGAVAILSTVIAIVGDDWPWEIPTDSLLWITLSGIIGLVLGDGFLFYAFTVIGPRLTMLIFALWPAMTAVMGFFWLGESLSGVAILGIAVTLGFVAWVAFERQPEGEPREPVSPEGPVTSPKPMAQPVTYKAAPGDAIATEAIRLDKIRKRSPRAVGLFAAVMAAFGQAAGYVLAKGAMKIDPATDTAEVSHLTVTVGRLMGGLVVIWILAGLQGKVLPTLKAVRNRVALWWLLAGVVVGPTLGLWLSHVAQRYTKVGIASTLMSTIPIWVIPVTWALYGERPTWRAVVGAAGAVAGIAILTLLG